MVISSFKTPEHRFMSSMEKVRRGVVTRDGVVVDSVEIGYQADKFSPGAVRDRVLAMPNGYAAKSLANKLVKSGEATIVEDWYDAGKLSAMRWYVRQKFGRNPDVAKALIGTGDKLLVEGNERDDFWGACPTAGNKQELVGQNELGILLMDTRGLLGASIDLVSLAEADNSPVYPHEAQVWTID